MHHNLNIYLVCIGLNRKGLCEGGTHVSCLKPELFHLGMCNALFFFLFLPHLLYSGFYTPKGD